MSAIDKLDIGTLFIYHNGSSLRITCSTNYAHYMIDEKKLECAYIKHNRYPRSYQEPVTGQHAMEKVCNTGMYSPKWWRL